MVTEASIGAKVVLCILLFVPEHILIPTKDRFVGKGFESGVYIYISYPQYFQVSNLFAWIVGLFVFHIIPIWDYLFFIYIYHILNIPIVGLSCGHEFLSQRFESRKNHRTGAEAPRGASQAPIDDLMESQWDNGNIMGKWEYNGIMES